MFFNTKITPKNSVTAGRRPPGPPMGGSGNNSAGRTSPQPPMGGVQPARQAPAQSDFEERPDLEADDDLPF